MTVIDIIVLAVIAGICGSLAQSIAGFTRGGCLISIVLGFIGAMLGNWLSGLLKLPEIIPVTIGGKSFPIIWSIIGAVIFVAVLGFITRARNK